MCRSFLPFAGERHHHGRPGLGLQHADHVDVERGLRFHDLVLWSRWRRHWRRDAGTDLVVPCGIHGYASCCWNPPVREQEGGLVGLGRREPALGVKRGAS